MRVKFKETGFVDHNDTGYYSYRVVIDETEEFEISCNDRAGWDDTEELDEYLQSRGSSFEELEEKFCAVAAEEVEFEL